MTCSSSRGWCIQSARFTLPFTPPPCVATFSTHRSGITFFFLHPSRILYLCDFFDSTPPLGITFFFKPPWGITFFFNTPLGDQFFSTPPRGPPHGFPHSFRDMPFSFHTPLSDHRLGVNAALSVTARLSTPPFGSFANCSQGILGSSCCLHPLPGSLAVFDKPQPATAYGSAYAFRRPLLYCCVS